MGSVRPTLESSQEDNLDLFIPDRDDRHKKVS